MTRPLTPETLAYDLALAAEPQISPDGERIVYTLVTGSRATRQAVAQLWRCARDGSAARRLTWSGERNSGAHWSPDGSQIAFVSSRAPYRGIFVIPADGGEARELTRHSQALGDLEWSPDGAQIAYTTLYDPDNPDEQARPADAAPRVRVTRRIDYKQDNRGYLGDSRLHVFIVDVASGRRRRLTGGANDHHHPRWSPDGRWIAVQRPNRGGYYSQLAIISVETGAEALVGPAGGFVGAWAWSPSGDRIVIAGETSKTYQLEFLVYDVARGELRQITHDLDVQPDAGFPTLAPPAHPVWLDGQRVLFLATRAGGSGLYLLNMASGEVEAIKTWQATHSGLSVDGAGRYVVQAHSSLERAGELMVYDLQTGAGQLITDYSAAVMEDAPMAAWERIAVVRGDLTIDAWLLKPPAFDPARRYPLILDVHGGPHGFYGYSANLVQQCLATHDFLVLFANPRGSTSYGRQFTQLVRRDWGGEDYQDLMAIVDAAVARPYVDQERLGIYGYSYGGYMTAWAIGQSDRFRAAVCGAPVFDLRSFYGSSDIGHAFGEYEWGGPPHELAEWCAARSPSTYAHRARTPTLIVHGEADERCPIGQGEQMFVALLKAGCEVEFVRYPGGSHLFMSSGPLEHRADYLRRVLGWFKEHLGEPA